jgi:hypothetical protein
VLGLGSVSSGHAGKMYVHMSGIERTGLKEAASNSAGSAKMRACDVIFPA